MAFLKVKWKPFSGSTSTKQSSSMFLSESRGKKLLRSGDTNFGGGFCNVYHVKIYKRKFNDPVVHTHTSVLVKSETWSPKICRPQKADSSSPYIFPIYNSKFTFLLQNKRWYKNERESTKQRYVPLFDILQHIETA